MSRRMNFSDTLLCANAGKNYQFKETLQKQLKAGMQALVTFATPADKSTAVYSSSSQVLQNLMLTSSALQ